MGKGGKGKGCKGKGKGKGKGKSNGKKHSSGKGSGKEKGRGRPEAPVGLKDCRVHLGEESQDEIIDLIRQLSLSDGPRSSDEENFDCASFGTNSDEDEDEEDYDAEDYDEEEEEEIPRQRSAARIQQDKDMFVKKLISEDQMVTRNESAPSIETRQGADTTVRLYICDAGKMEQKPKGPIIVRRHGAEGLNEVLKFAKKNLGSMKGTNATKLHAYLVGMDATVSFKLLGTSRLADDSLVAVSKHICTKEVEDPLAVESPASASKPAFINPPAAETETLDAVRAAYEKRSHAGDWPSSHREPLSTEEVRELNVELAEHTRTYATNPELATMRATRAALPAASTRDEFVAALACSQVVIVAGETGSGKTTQCPNFILEAASEAGRGGEVSIICTQPRRISAVSVAQRVAAERGEEPGGVVGHAVRLDSCASRRTRLLFCTTGVLLQRLNTSRNLCGVTHVVVDEAHERSLHTDFVLVLLREVLERRPDLRVVVMSATLEQGLFENYFKGFAFDPSDDLPVVCIAGRTFPLEIRYLPRVHSAAGRPASGISDKGAEQEEQADELDSWTRRMYGAGKESQVMISPEVKNKADYSLIADLCAAILRGDLGAEKGDTGAILIFLPGYAEIDRCIRTLKDHSGVGARAWLLPLHGSLSIKDQQLVFRRPHEGQRKIICATNVAETSITIDDVTHVVDSGHVRETRYSPHRAMTIFSTVWVSASAAKQRAGRASRTKPGICWRLYEEVFLEKRLPKHTMCEMRRTALEELVLQLRLLEPGVHPNTFLQTAPEPPSSEAVDAAVELLVTIGALGSNTSMPLTPLGFHLAHLPLDARTGKMLIYSALCGCLAPMLTIAACLSQKSIFVRNFNAAKEAQQRRAREHRFGDLCSDHLATAAAYDEYQAAVATGGREAAWALCEELGLSSYAIDSVAQLRKRFLQELVEIGFAESGGKDGGALANLHRDQNDLVRCMICAGLFPNVAQVQRHQGGQGKVTLISRTREECVVHPMSLNARKQASFASDTGWLLFHQKVQTSQIFLQDSTLVGPIPLLLFGSELKVDRTRTHFMTGGISFRTKKEVTTVLLRAFRRELDRILVLKVADPSADLAASASTLLKTLTRLLQLEDRLVSGIRVDDR